MTTIALVNDEKVVAESLAMKLRSEGYDVRIYHRSDRALEALLEHAADLALLDGTNPPLGGIELFRRLRQHTNMPVIFVSAWADEIKRRLSGTDLEAEDYIEIPDFLDDFAARVRAVVPP